MTTLSLVIPQLAQPDTTEDVKVQNAFTAIQTVINGNLDSTNLTAATAQSAAINQSGQAVKGAVNTAASQSTSSTTFTTLATPDQVAGITMPTNGLIAVWYQASWASTIANAGFAAIFVGSNQVQAVLTASATSPAPQQAQTSSANTGLSLASHTGGLASGTQATNYTGDVVTGQIVSSGALVANTALGGPCYIFASAGTYSISIQFKATSGSVTVSNRKLWVQALAFA